MPNPRAGADRILFDLRYASVDGPPGRAVPRRIPSPRLPRLPYRDRGPAPAMKRVAWAASALAASAVVASLGGCARGGEPATFAVPRAAAAEIRLVCPPGSFVGTMTVNCPQPLPRPLP